MKIDIAITKDKNKCGIELGFKSIEDRDKFLRSVRNSRKKFVIETDFFELANFNVISREVKDNGISKRAIGKMEEYKKEIKKIRISEKPNLNQLYRYLLVVKVLECIMQSKDSK